MRQIIYVGGLGDGRGQNLSPHLRSRQEVGNVLRGSAVSVTEFRASIVIGSGSLSFELIRTLVERLPIMICPKWVSTPAQPIAIEDLLGYLVAALDLPVEENRIFEIGGTDQVSYGGIMKEYAKQRGLRRLMISVPVLTPRLSSLWLGLVTPIYARIGRKLIDSLQNPTLVQDPSAISVFGIKARGLEEAIQRALSNEACELAEIPMVGRVLLRRVSTKLGRHSVRKPGSLTSERFPSAFTLPMPSDPYASLEEAQAGITETRFGGLGVSSICS